MIEPILQSETKTYFAEILRSLDQAIATVHAIGTPADQTPPALRQPAAKNAS
jgi:hypothetical protein